jgi:hypothetical protein
MSNNDNEISFTRKDENNPNMTIIKKFGTPKKYLDQYIQGTEIWKEINKFNLFYVLQTKLSIEDSVFKVGVSAGERRLKDLKTINKYSNFHRERRRNYVHTKRKTGWICSPGDPNAGCSFLVWK